MNRYEKLINTFIVLAITFTSGEVLTRAPYVRSLFFTANAALANFTFREVKGNTMQVYKLWHKSFGHNEIQFIASLTVC